VVVGRRRSAILYSPTDLRPNKDLRRFDDSDLNPTYPTCCRNLLLLCVMWQREKSDLIPTCPTT
jgi:hypothetical protein